MKVWRFLRRNMAQQCQILLCLALLCLTGCAAQPWAQDVLGDIRYSRSPDWGVYQVDAAEGGEGGAQSVALDLDRRGTAVIALFYYGAEAPGYQRGEDYYISHYGDGTRKGFRDLSSQPVEGRPVRRLSFWTEGEDSYYVEQYLVDGPQGLCVVSLSCLDENPVAVEQLQQVVESIRFFS